MRVLLWTILLASSGALSQPVRIGCISIIPPSGWEQGTGQQGLTTFKSPESHQVGSVVLRDVFTVRRTPASGLSLSKYKSELENVLAQQADQIDATVDGALGSRAKGIGLSGRGAAQTTDTSIDGVPAFEVRINTKLTVKDTVIPTTTHSVTLLAGGMFYGISASVARDRLSVLGPTAESFIRSIRASACK